MSSQSNQASPKNQDSSLWDGPVLPLHPALLERLFAPPESWESIFETTPNLPGIQPSIGRSVGRILRFLCDENQVRMALDIGTGTGYSACVLAAIVGTGGKVVSVEKNPRLAAFARRNLKQAGVADRVAVIEGDAIDVLYGLRGPFDLILLDSDKRTYSDLLDICVQLLDPNGLLVADDIDFVARDFEPGLRHYSRSIAGFLKNLLARKDLTSIYLPVGDGISISRRIHEEIRNQLILPLSDRSKDESTSNPTES